MNQSHKKITFYTTEPSDVIIKDDTIKTYNNEVTLYIKRKNEVIEMIAIADSLAKNFEIEPKNSLMYWSNIFCNFGMGMLVDRKNPKRYSYPRRIYINSTDTLNRFYKYHQVKKKGELDLHISLPHVNSFMLKPEDEKTKINTGFWGLTIGLNYYHSKNQFINLGVSGVSDFFVPVPAAIDLSGEYELMSSRFISVSNNHHINRFSFGYGLSYARNNWNFRYYDRFDPPPPTRDPIKRSHQAFGFVFPTYYLLAKHFHLGVVYRPTFFRPNLTNNFRYEHVISLDFAYKIRIKK